MAVNLKLLSTTPVAHLNADGQPSYYSSVSNDAYVVVSLSDGSTYIFSSTTGSVLHEKTFFAKRSPNSLLLDGDNIILTHDTNHELIVYNIPTE